MKKKLLLTLFFILSFTLVACGKEDNSSNDENTTSQSNITEENNIELNATKQTDRFEVTLSQVELTKSVNDKIGQDYLLPTSSSSILTAANDKIFLMFDIDLKYIGKEELNAALGAFVVNYGDGYKFEDQKIYIKYNGSSDWEHMYSKESGEENMYFTTFEPLDETHYTLRGYMEIPAIVETETTEPLTLTINILGEQFTYTIR